MKFKDYILNILSENDPEKFKISKDMYDTVNKHSTFDSFMRAGGFSTEQLDRLAFGFSEDDIKTIDPSKLNIKWKVDLENVYYEIEKSGLTPKQYAEKINLTEPIDVVYEKGKLYIDDGHHRFFAAKLLKKPLNVNLEIKDLPIKKLTNLGYDSYCKKIYDLVKSNKIITERKSDTDFYQFANKLYTDYKNNQPNNSDIKIITDQALQEPAKSIPKKNIMYINPETDNETDFKVAFFHELKHIWDYDKIGSKAFEQERLKQSTIDKLNRNEMTTADIQPEDFEYNIPHKINQRLKPMYRELTGKEISDSQLNFLKYFSTNHELNAFFVNLMVELLEFIKGKSLSYPTVLVDKFLNSERDVNSELYKNIRNLKINGKYDKFRNRLVSFLVDMKKENVNDF